MYIYSGTAPESADGAATGTLLVSLLISSFPDNKISIASGKKITWTGPYSGTISVTGTAGWFRIRKSADSGAFSATELRIDGSVGTSDADVILGTVSLVDGNALSVPDLTLSADVLGFDGQMSGAFL